MKSANRVAFHRREEWIRGFWVNTPAVITVKEITSRADLPKWENCPKNHLYVGIMHGKKTDTMLVVKHQSEVAVPLKCRFDDLLISDMQYIGVQPNSTAIQKIPNPHTCDECGEFATRINIDGRCQDCHRKGKLVPV